MLLLGQSMSLVSSDLLVVCRRKKDLFSAYLMEKIPLDSLEPQAENFKDHLPHSSYSIQKLCLKT